MRGASLLDRFEDKYIPEPNSGCWLWIGATTGRDGRGSLALGSPEKGNIYARRASWVLFCGEIPDGISVLHTCDMPCCVNPDHLFLGTQLDNMRDCARKGRIVRVVTRGEECSWSRLSGDQVSEIKTRALSTREYADKFKIRIEQVNKIQRGEKWAHIVPPFVVDKLKRIQTEFQAKRAAYMRKYNARQKAKNAS